MARLLEHQKALALRKSGKSYSQIKQLLGISKSTLNGWLKSYPLTRADLDRLCYKNEIKIEKYRQTMQNKRNKRLDDVYASQKKNISFLTDREIFIAGLFLYWGEGSKTKNSSICVSNTNPSIIKFFILWATKTLNVPRDKFRIIVHLYENMNIKKELNYWSKLLEIPLNQFYKPYIKKNNNPKLIHKGSHEHGTCNISVNGVNLAEHILMAIKFLEDSYK